MSNPRPHRTVTCVLFALGLAAMPAAAAPAPTSHSVLGMMTQALHVVRDLWSRPAPTTHAVAALTADTGTDTASTDTGTDTASTDTGTDTASTDTGTDTASTDTGTDTASTEGSPEVSDTAVTLATWQSKNDSSGLHCSSAGTGPLRSSGLFLALGALGLAISRRRE